MLGRVSMTYQSTAGWSSWRWWWWLQKSRSCSLGCENRFDRLHRTQIAANVCFNVSDLMPPPWRHSLPSIRRRRRWGPLSPPTNTETLSRFCQQTNKQTFERPTVVQDLSEQRRTWTWSTYHDGKVPSEQLAIMDWRSRVKLFIISWKRWLFFEMACRVSWIAWQFKSKQWLMFWTTFREFPFF